MPGGGTNTTYIDGIVDDLIEAGLLLKATLDATGVHTTTVLYSADFDAAIANYYHGMSVVIIDGTDFGEGVVYLSSAPNDSITLSSGLYFTPSDGATVYLIPGNAAIGTFYDGTGANSLHSAVGYGGEARTEPGTSQKSVHGALHYVNDGLKGEIDDYNRVMGKRQVLEVSVTSAANAADTTLATVEDQPCVIEQVVVSADAAPHADFTNCSVKGGVNKVVTFIAKADCTDADLTVADEQVTWDNQGAVARLAATKTIVMEHTGDGAGPLDLTVTIVYYAAVSGGYLA